MTQSRLTEMNVLLERFPYRYVETDDRGFIEKYYEETRKWRLMYECDSRLQLLTAMEDFDYTKWLDPSGVPCYTKNIAKHPQYYYEEAFK